MTVEQPARFELVVNLKIACALGIMAVRLLIGSTRTMSDPALVFRQRLRKLGNVEGRNMIVDIDELDGRFDQLPRPVRVGASRRQIILLYNPANGDAMTDKITPLTTEHLRIVRDDIASLGKRMDAGFTDIKKRLSRVEQTMIGLKRDEAETAAELT